MTSLDEFADDDIRTRMRSKLLLAQIRSMEATIAELRDKVDILTAVDGVTVTKVKEWKRSPRRKGNVGIANLLLSDIHLDEVVDPEAMNGVNAYDRRIAGMRLRRTFEKFLTVSFDHIAGMTYEGACVPFIGDFFSGNIHEELARTNEASIIESVDFWIDPMVAGLRMVADEFGSVHVPCIVGNHGRNTQKPVHKGAVKDNFDWLFYRQVARALASDKRITFDIPNATWTQTVQYGTTFHYEHGDRGFSGGGGIAGLFSPLMRGDMKLRKRQSAIKRPYDVLCIGHFHQYLAVPSYGLICNGSIKGLDEYAQDGKFGHEPPQQAFYVTTPENGVTFSGAILPCDRKEEGW